MTPTEPRAVRILGIDPGSLRTGFGLVEERAGRLRLVRAGAVAPRSDAPLAARLAAIFDELERMIAEELPDEVAVESLFHAKNSRSALLLGHARGIALLVAARRGLPVFEYAPQQVKRALVGTGRAEKSQVQSMVRLLLALPQPLTPHDASDGAAIAICHAHSRRLASLARLPASSPSLGAGRR